MKGLFQQAEATTLERGSAVAEGCCGGRREFGARFYHVGALGVPPARSPSVSVAFTIPGGILPPPMSALLLLALLASTLGGPASAAAANKALTSRAEPADSVTPRLAELERWSQRGVETNSQKLSRAVELLGDLDRAWVFGQDRSEEIQLGLLDFLGRCIRIEGQVVRTNTPFEPGIALNGNGEDDLRRRAREILRRRLPESRRSLTLGVLMGKVDGEPHPLDRRLAACEVLEEDRHPETSLALLSCTRPVSPDEPSPGPLLDAAIAGLAGRDDPGVHLRLLELLRQAEEGRVALWKGGIEDHFEGIELRRDDKRSLDAVTTFVSESMVHENWRRASRGVGVAHCLPHSRAFPQLIASLAVWVERQEEEGRAVRRVQGEILAELQRRSGRTLGARPERWKALWEGYKRGEVQLSGEGQPLDRMTVGGFFGLRPETDRVTFVLDRSGSMAANFGDRKSHSRLEEAAEQMSELLRQLGERTYFNVVVFSDDARAWRTSIQRADAKNIKSASNWVRTNGARGGTHLQAGVFEAMQVDSKGRVDLDKLETDTIVVLCDGQTAEGPNWVHEFLRRVNDDARVVFYAVQLGLGGDGALEALCEASGGEYQLVEG